MQIASGHVVSGLFEQKGDAGHAYAAHSCEMVSFRHDKTG
jgi:hypothetical protein